MRVNRAGIILLIIICAAILAVALISQLRSPEKTRAVGWREDFDSARKEGKQFIPEGWRVKGKPGTRAAVFSIVKGDKNDASFLRAEADDASATLPCHPEGVNVEETPVLRWRWKAEVLPKGADGRVKAKDDQAIGIYIGTGSLLNNKSVSYRWDTETPKGAEGKVSYGAGTVDVKWFTLRNKEDIKNGKWFVEERNIAEDFKKAWGFYPEKIYLGISCNSQYTDSKAVSDLSWIEFVSDPENI
jgi:hypothetical protein